MQRDIKKSCDEYDRKFTGIPGSTKGAFYASDFIQIKDLVLEKMGESRNISAFLYEAIDISLRAGFMIGYRCGRRENRRRPNVE